MFQCNNCTRRNCKQVDTNRSNACGGQIRPKHGNRLIDQLDDSSLINVKVVDLMLKSKTRKDLVKYNTMRWNIKYSTQREKQNWR